MNVRSLSVRVPVAVLIFCVAAPLFAADYTASTSGDFNTATNYTPTANLPFTSADHITIDPGVTLTVSSDTTVGSITIAAGGGSGVFINSGITLDVLGFNINGYGIQMLGASAGNNLISVGSGMLNVTEVVSLNAGASFASGLSAGTGGTIDVGGVLANGTLANCKIDLSAGSALFRTSGDISSGLTFSRGTSTTEFYGTANPQNVDFSGPYYSVKVNKSSGTFLTFSSILTLDGDLDIAGGILTDNGLGITSSGTATTLSIAANAELELGIQTSATSTGMPAFDNYAFNSASKVTYGAAAAQTILSTPAYGHLNVECLSTCGTQTRTADGNLQINGDLSVLQSGISSVTFAAGGNIVTLAGALLGNGGVDLGATGHLVIDGNYNNTGTLTAAGKVEYAGGSGQNVKVATYNELVFTGTGTHFLLGTVTTNSLDVGAPSFVNTQGNTLNVEGSATINGTINGGGAVNFNNSGSFTIDGTGNVFSEVTSNDRTIVAGSVLAFGLSFEVTGIVLNSGSVTISVNLDGADALKTWTQDTGSSLVIGGTIAGTMTFDADAVGNTVTYNGGNQSIYPATYYHLTLTSTFPAAKSVPSISAGGDFSIAGQSNATLTGSLTVQGNIDVAGTSTFDSGSFGISVFGNWTNAGTFTPGTGSVGFDGSGPQDITGGPFYTVSFSDPGETKIQSAMVVLNDFTINSTAIVSPQSGVTINIGGDFNNSGTYNEGTTEVILDGTGAQTIGATSPQLFYALTIGPSSSSTFSGPQFSVLTDLGVSGILSIGTTALSVSEDLILAGVLNMNTGSVNLDGDFTHNGTFNSGGTFSFTGTAPQALSGTASAIDFATVTFNNPSGINIDISVLVNSGTVNLTDGVVAMGSGKTFSTSGGSLTRTNGYFTGRLQRSETGAGAMLFPTGSATTGYAPMTFTPSIGGALLMEVVDVPHPSNTGGNSEILQLYWKIHSSTFTGPASFIWDWQPAAVDGTESNYVVAYHDGSFWSTPGGTVGTNSANISGVSTYVGDWTAADPASVTDLSYFEITANPTTTAGATENVTITAKNASNVTLTGYAGDHTFVFSGVANSPGGDSPVVYDKDLNAIAFGNNTTLTFTGGVATTQMILYTAGSHTISAAGDANGTLNIDVAAASASELSFTDINGGNTLYANGPFYVVVESTDAYGNTSNVATSTDVQIDTSNCGTCAGTTNTPTGTIGAGASSVAIANITYDVAESGVVLTAAATTGDALASADSAAQLFQAQVGSIVVTTDADSGAGSLREALELNNAGGCATPCNVTFLIPGAGPHLIAITTGGGLPSISQPITLDATTEDGYAGTPLVGVDGTGVGGLGGFMIESSALGSTIRGLSITNFNKAISINADNNVVESCWIGLDTLGVAAGNDYGIDISDGSSNTIGGITAGAGNVIAANTSGGIQLQGTTDLTTIVGNIIGLDPTGTTAMSNDYGIKLVESATNNTIGGTTAAERNIISGNTTAGIYFEGGGIVGFARNPGNDSPASEGIFATIVSGNSVYGNYIGTDITGTAAVGNGYGVQIAGSAKTNTIGSSSGPNVISGNVKAIYISASTAEGNLIHSNYIGVNASLASIPNTFVGISVGDGLDNHIGGLNAGEGNVIATNVNEGVLVLAGTGTVILGNSIYGNSGQGIDLNDDGPDTNDVTDPDLGANGTQNYPDITSAEMVGSDLNLTFSLDSTDPNASPAAIRVEIFEVDDNTSEEGQTLIGASPCLLGAAFSNYALNFTGTPLVVGDEIVATATSYADAGCGAHDDGTSEFSSPATVVAACTPPNVTISGATDMCAGSGPVILDAGTHTSYLWSTSETTQTISVNPGSTQTYTVTVTDASGCSNTDSHTLTVNPNPNVTISGPASACDSAVLSVPGGFTSVVWSTTETTDSITVTSSGTYSVTVTDANGCTATDTHFVTITSSPTATIIGPATSCGPATLDAGAGFVSYLWSTSETTQTISATTSGTYSVTVTDSNGCTATDTHTITVNSAPTATITGPTTSCGPAALDAGTGFVSYLWSTSETTQTISATTSGTYSVTVTDANGCTATDTHTITVNSAPTATITGPATSCGPATLDAGTGFVSYLWSTSETTQTISATTSGTYSVTVTDSNGCTATDTHTITVNAVPTATITGPATSCGPATLDAGTGFVSYLWSTSETTQTISATTSGTYSVTVTDANGCTATDTHTITVNAAPTATITGPATSCGPATLDAGGGFVSYLWSTSETTQTISATTSGTYSVTVTDSNGCTATDTHTITVNSAPTATITGPATSCGPAALDAGTGFVSYLWSTSETTQTISATTSGTYSVTVTDSNGCTATDTHTITVNSVPTATITGPATSCGPAALDAGTGFVSYLWSTSETTQTISATTSGTYSVTVTDSNGCTATDTHTITVNAAPTATITGPATSCGPATLDAGGGFVSYLWSTSETTQTISATTSGTYHVTVTDANGCTATDTHTITVNPVPTATITGPATACDSASLDAGAGFVSYLWSTAETTQTINVTTSGTYSVTVTDANGCTATDTHTITVNSSPTATITGPATSCGSGSLDAGAGFVSYLWSTAETTQTINVTTSGTYSVTVTDANGCTATDTHTITVNSVPTATITGPATACGSASLDAGAGFVSYLWSTSETTQTINVTASGTYSVTVTDGNGCTATDTHTITVSPGTPVNITGPTTACDTAALDAGAGFVSYLWSTAETTQTINVTTSGTYSVTATDANGCTATDTHTVTINSSPAAVITGPANACGSATLDAGAGYASYLWSTGDLTQTINVTASGTYSVTVTDANGCSANDTHTITVSAGTPVNITGPTSACGSATLDAGAGFASYLWSTGETTRTINVTAGGTYSVTATDGNGCAATDSHTLTVNVNPNVVIIGPASACGSATLDAGPGFVAYLWSTGETTQAVNVTASGTYSVTITDANGCTATDTHGITINNAPAVTITGPTASCATATLDAGTGFASYLWSTGETTQTINVTASGTYSVTVSDGNGCSGSDSHNITINPAGAANITGPASMCAGQSIVLDAGTGFSSYLWSTGETTQAITVSPATSQSYSVTVSDGNGCNGTDTHNVTVFPAATATITPDGPTTFCTGGSVTLTANAGASYLWSTGATSQSIPVNTSGTFSVTVTDVNGCSATSSPQSVVVEPLPTPVITGPTSTCAAGAVTLDAGAGFASYLWSNGATTQTISVSPNTTATFSVTVTTAGGCSGSDSHTVTVTSNPVAVITAPANICAGATGTASVSAQGGATYLWTITNGTINGSAANDTVSFTAGATGSVTLSVTVTSGSCTSSGNTSIPISTTPAVNISGPVSVCPNASFTLDAGAGFASYLWSNGATTRTILLTQSAATATYSVTVTNGAGCSATDTHAVTLNPTPSAAITAPASADPNTAGLTASVPADTDATYTWGISNGSITAGQGSPSITFTSGASGVTTLSVLVTSNGCNATSTHDVTINGTTPPEETADLSITKTAPASVQTGATLVYTIQVANAGPDAATDVTVSDVLPSGTTFVSFDGGAFNCAQLPSGIFCTGALAAGDSTTITITVNAPQQSGTITNTATVESTIDPNAFNDSASATTVITSAPVNCATVPPALLSPADNATIASPATLSWSAVEGALEYEVWLVTADGTTLAGATSATSLTKALASGTYDWFVIARLGTDCESLTSAQRTFAIQQSQNCSTQAPQLNAPSANATVASPVTFGWTAVPQAIGYRVSIEANGTAAQDVGTTDGAITLTANVPAGTIVAYVDAIFGGCPETRSAPVTFLVAEPDPCAIRTPATPLAPAQNAIVDSSSVEFRWHAANGADGYRVWHQRDGSTPAILGITTEETSLRANIGFGVVDWWLETVYDGCASVDSEHFRFTIPRRSECNDTRPTLLAPANNSTVTNAMVTFSWNAVPSAIEYELWLSAGGGTPTLIGTTAATTLTHDVPPGRLEWFVRANVDRCDPRDSQTFRFEYDAPDDCLDAQRAVGVAPLHNARVTSPVDFSWSRPDGAVSFDLFVARGDDDPQFVLSTADTQANGVELANGKLRWFVRAHFAACSPLDSSKEKLEVIDEPAACATLDVPQISAESQISSGVPFRIRWDAIPGATSYQLQLANNASFDGAEVISTDDTHHALARTNMGAEPLPLFARVRAIDSRCKPEATVTPYGDRVLILILPAGGNDGAAPLDGGIVTFHIPLGSELAGSSFSVSVRESWITVTPSSGIVGPNGTTLVVTANTSALPLGSSLTAIRITLDSPASGNIRANATSINIPTIAISKVTPVNPSPSSTPPPDALIIPAVAHADGINSKFQSDVRVTNSSAQLLQYQVTFTPSGTGLASSKQTQFSIEPGRTIALDDVLKSWFGTGGASVTGTLQIRPLTQTATSTPGAAFPGLSNLVTFAASRTFNVTANGTFGQYIPAIPFANFIGRAQGLTPTILSLQQIAQSDRYRTNLGLVEASGQPVSLLVKVFGDNGTKLTEFPVNLAGGQHTQLNGFLATNGISSLNDGRVEISVTSNGGKVTAYASVLDNKTNDPLLVSPVTVSDVGATRWVLPGVADINNGTANWQTDMRVFNAGTEAAEATFFFYSQNGGAPKTATISVPPGQVKQFDKSLATIFGVANDGGAVHITTPSSSRLVATARTYNQTSGGTYGQFISAVTPNEAAGVGSRPLQILQVEESTRFRSNIGLAEVTGNPVKLELTIVPPDAKFTVVTELTLQANEFRQLTSMLKSAGLSDTFNARVTVRAIEGNGRVTAYASVIDLLTNDPTFIPAQ